MPSDLSLCSCDDISHHRPTHVVVLTPPGRGAVATVVVAGPEATEAVARQFHAASGAALPLLPLGRIALGRWGHVAGEELVVCRRSPDEVEVHCHGGVAAVAAIVESLVEAGCRSLPWQRWANVDEDDPIRAQALVALAHARTERTAAILLDQYQGALGRGLNEIVADLESNDTHSIAAAAESLRTLLGRAHVGRHLVEPFRIVLAGRPNVGKSSLMNALVGYRRSIVYDQPGTTRDLVTASTAIDGWPVELADTAGLRPGDDELEAAGVQLARQRLAGADVRVLIFDASSAWSPEDDELRASWSDALVVHHKSDLPPAEGPRPGGMWTSAVTLKGIDELIRLLGERLVPRPPPPGAAVPFQPEHVAALTQSLGELERGEVSAAAAMLRGLGFRR